VILRTTPPVPLGSKITTVAHWPEMTTLVDVTEQSIVVRHDPPVGFQHKVRLNTGQEVDAVVKSVDDQAIVTSTASVYPLAGRDVTFDVFVESLTT
jgi:FKBP-type peptidyl-prolyl cis-trans isomerase 2